MNLETAFGHVLREYRHKANMSQEALALECGLDRTFISALERGIRQPSLKSIFSIANRLEVAPSQLVVGVENLLEEK